MDSARLARLLIRGFAALCCSFVVLGITTEVAHAAYQAHQALVDARKKLAEATP